MSKKFLSGINVTGTATLNTVANAGLDTDKFLVLDAAGNVDFRTGDELKADIGADVVSRIEHEVKLGETMTIGTPVYVGVDLNAGTNMTVYKATNATEAGSSKTLGLIASSGITNDLVEVVTEGLLAGLNTSAATKGDPVWLGVNGALLFGLANKPVAPAHMVFLGIVTRVQSNNGEIFVKVQNGFEMNEIHNYLEGSVQNNEVIVYESATSLYKPKSIPAILGYTPVPNSRTITINGTSYDLSADRSWTISANLNARTEYEFTTDGTTATYSAVYSIGQVDVFYNGSKLSSTEFTATNGTSVTLGFTPPSGQLVEVVAWETGGGVSIGRTLTINGVTYDLSANRTWTLTTTNISEGTNLYFTNARAQSAVSGIYLPLSGGTLTGALSGTSATFSGAVQTSRIKLIEPTYSTNYTIYTGVDNSNSIGIYNETSGVYNLKIASTGAATFSSSVTATQLIQSADNSTEMKIGRYNSSFPNAYIDAVGPSGDVGFQFRTQIAGAGGGTKMVITPTGNVGIGTSNPLQTSANRTVLTVNGTNQSIVNLGYSGNLAGYLYGDNSNYTELYSIGQLALLANASQPMTFSTNGSERMRITSGGNVGIGTSSPAAKLEIAHDGNGTTNTYSGIHIKNTSGSVGSNVAARLSFSGDGNASMAGILEQRRDGGDTFWLRTLAGYSGNGAIYIQSQTNGVYLAKDATSWTSNSDERLKDINTNIKDAVAKLKTLRAVNFSWKSDKSKKEILGLIAQDVEKVFPQAIDKSKLGNGDDTEYLGVRYQDLIPVLVASIQEQQTQIEELKALIAAK